MGAEQSNINMMTKTDAEILCKRLETAAALSEKKIAEDQALIAQNLAELAESYRQVSIKCLHQPRFNMIMTQQRQECADAEVHMFKTVMGIVMADKRISDRNNYVDRLKLVVNSSREEESKRA